MLLYLSVSVLIQSTVYSSGPSIAEQNPEGIEMVVGIKSQKIIQNNFSEWGVGNWREYKSKVAWKMYIR